MLAIFGDTKYNKFSNTKFEGTCVYGICRTKPAAGGLPAMRRPGWLSCARGRGAVLRGMRASARAVFAAGTSEIEKKKAGNVLTNITCLCFHYTIDEYGVSSLRKGRKCERNPSGVSFAFNSRPQASQSAAQTAYQKRKTRLCVSSFFGAGGRTRTGTPSLAVDFESTTSTNSITPALPGYYTAGGGK